MYIHTIVLKKDSYKKFKKKLSPYFFGALKKNYLDRDDKIKKESEVIQSINLTKTFGYEKNK